MFKDLRRKGWTKPSCLAIMSLSRDRHTQKHLYFILDLAFWTQLRPLFLSFFLCPCVMTQTRILCRISNLQKEPAPMGAGSCHFIVILGHPRSFGARRLCRHDELHNLIHRGGHEVWPRRHPHRRHAARQSRAAHLLTALDVAKGFFYNNRDSESCLQGAYGNGNEERTMTGWESGRSAACWQSA